MHRERRDDPATFGDQDQPAAHAAARRPCGDVLPVEFDATAGKPLDAEQGAQQRRLAGAVRAEHGDDLAAREVERNAANGVDAVRSARRDHALSSSTTILRCLRHGGRDRLRRGLPR